MRFRFGLCLLAVSAFTSCGDDVTPVVRDAGDGGGPLLCDQDTPCPTGQSCNGGVCQATTGDGGTADVGVGQRGARLQLCTPEGCMEPYSASFGGSRVGVTASRTLVLRSIGTEPVEVREIGLVGTSNEFSVDPQGQIDVTLMPNDELAMSAPHRVHFVGIGGVGMSGIAELLIGLGHIVSGSDLRQSDATARLTRLGAAIYIGHDGSALDDQVEVVVISSAVRYSNPEVVRARELGIPVVPRAEMLAELMRMKAGIAIAGTHGKTTTTSLVASVLAAGGLDPTAVIGGRVHASVPTSARGRGLDGRRGGRERRHLSCSCRRRSRCRDQRRSLSISTTTATWTRCSEPTLSSSTRSHFSAPPWFASIVRTFVRSCRRRASE